MRHLALAAAVALAALMAGLVAIPARPALAVAADECEKQRARFPADWNDVSAEEPVWDCRAHYAGVLRVLLGRTDDKGRRPMTLLPMRGAEPSEYRRDPDRPIFRIWLDREQTKRLEEGVYFATVVRAEASCWIRGDLSDDGVFFMDAARPRPDTDDAGAFYNKAPRISVFSGNAWECVRAPKNGR
ncbi:MAG: hypothetical protein LWW93_17445 [Hyphomicrobiales bacterium]|nr:hypothetical protein [Hyphomicrobiales bacterium]